MGSPDRKEDLGWGIVDGLNASPMSFEMCPVPIFKPTITQK